MIVKYSEIRSRLDTGDVILFSANFLIARVIQVMTHSTYSHVGMIARYPDEQGELCFWEATTFKQLVDQSDRELHGGIRLVSLDKVLALYANFVPGGFSMRLLKADRTADFREAFERFVERVDARPMTGRFGMLFHWLEGRLLSLTTSEASMFCSQLVAATYQRTGLLPESPPANAYAPKDFGMQNSALPLLSGAHLGEELFVVWDGPTTTS